MTLPYCQTDADLVRLRMADKVSIWLLPHEAREVADELYDHADSLDPVGEEASTTFSAVAGQLVAVLFVALIIVALGRAILSVAGIV